MVHVVQEPDDGGVADGVAEEEVLHRRGPDHPEERDGEQEAPEPRGLPRVPAAHVVPEDALRLVLQHLHRVEVGQSSRLCEVMVDDYTLRVSGFDPPRGPP